jgi:hypothetical protein
MAVRNGPGALVFAFPQRAGNGMIQSMKRFISLLISCSLCSIMAVFAGDKASLNQAIESLNARANTSADKKLVLKAVSHQTGLPEKTLQSQMRATHLGYGELLTANSILEGSGKNLNAILAIKGAKSRTSLSKQLGVDPASIVDRLHNAEKTVLSGRAGLRAQNAQAARADKRGSDYGPQGGGPVGEGSSMSGNR